MVLSRVGLTGSSGMLGRHLITLLTDRKVDILATSRNRPDKLPANSTWASWDLSLWKNPEEIDELFFGVDALLHIGAMVPAADTLSRQAIFDANVRATLCLGQWALLREIPMIYISSSTVYADPNRAGIIESDEKTVHGFGGFYGLSKLMGEEVLTHLVGEGLKLCILRPSSIYGYGLPENKTICSFIKKAHLGEKIELIPPINDRIDLIHASDVAEAILQALEHEAFGIFNIASGFPSSILEIANTCVEVVGSGQVVIREQVTSQLPIVRFGLVCDAARDAFNYSPKYNLKKGIAKMWGDMQGVI